MKIRNHRMRRPVALTVFSALLLAFAGCSVSALQLIHPRFVGQHSPWDYFRFARDAPAIPRARLHYHFHAQLTCRGVAQRE